MPQISTTESGFLSGFSEEFVNHPRSHPVRIGVQTTCVIDRSGAAAVLHCSVRGVPWSALVTPVDLGVEEK